MRIRTKLILLLTGAVIGTMALATWLRVTLTRRQLEGQARQNAREVAEDIKRALVALPEGSDESDFARVLDSFVSQHQSLALAELQMIGTQYTATPGKRVEIKHRTAEFRPWSSLRSTRKIPGGERFVIVSLEIDPEGPMRGSLTTRTFLGPVDRLIKTQELVSLEVTAGAVLLLIVLIGGIAERVVVRPLQLLGSAMRDVEEGNLSRRLPESGGQDEVARLGSGFNRMIARLADADAEIRAFNQRLAAEVDGATRVLQEQNAALDKLNRLLLETRRELGDKERLAALGQLAAQLAHEIGTPLGSISGHLQLALSSRDCPAALRERLNVANREVERVGTIVRDYLDSTRPARPTLVAARLDRLIDEALEIARSARGGPAATPPVLIARRIDPAVETLVTDPGLLRQILVNLITNAFDAIAASSRGEIEIVAEPQAERALIRIQDNGAGVAPEDLNRIFEPFYTTKGRGKGTGLGLAICKELTSALGGRLSVESEPGKGSSFTVALPAPVATGSVSAA